MVADKIAIRQAQPHRYTIRPPASGCLAIRNIFLLSIQEDGRGLVYAVRFGNGCLLYTSDAADE